MMPSKRTSKLVLSRLLVFYFSPSFNFLVFFHHLPILLPALSNILSLCSLPHPPLSLILLSPSSSSSPPLHPLPLILLFPSSSSSQLYPSNSGTLNVKGFSSGRDDDVDILASGRLALRDAAKSALYRLVCQIPRYG